MKIQTLKTIECENIPDRLEDGYIYLSRRYKIAIHLCACGCGEQTVTPLDDGTRGWVMTECENGLTLRPSIGNQNMPCGSPYWVTEGRIEKC